MLACVLASPTIAAKLGAQGLDASPASTCGLPAASRSATTNDVDSRVLVRFGTSFSTAPEEAIVSRALGYLTAERIRQVVSADVRARGLTAGERPQSTSAAVEEGRVLGVRFILLAIVNLKDERIMVSYRLIDARSGREAGSGVLSRPLMNIEQLVEFMGSMMAREFKTAGQPVRSANKVRTTTSPALMAFLRAVTLLDTFDRAQMDEIDALLMSAVAKDPTFEAAHLHAAQVAVRRLEYVEQQSSARATSVHRGLGHASAVLRTDPYSPQALALLGRLHLAAGDTALARIDADALRRHEPRDVASVLTLEALRLQSIGRDNDALQRLRAATAHDVRDVGLLMTYADLERRVGDSKSACRALNRVVTIDPGYAPAYVWRAVVRSTLGERREAWADAEVAERLGRADWGSITAALIDVSVHDTVRAQERIKVWMTAPRLASAGWLDLLLRASVNHALHRAPAAQLSLARMDCDDPRRRALEHEPLLRYLRLPSACGGAKVAQ
ncbi:MAG: hypothetical protein IBJ03_17655 [Gemmatimonadaceae bacterium]|nr:hypothetical protein [Gemmatimonadaceae bacterium]